MTNNDYTYMQYIGERFFDNRFASKKEVKGKLIIKQPNTDIDEENPKTGDNVVLYLVIGSLSLIGLTVCSLTLNRKRFN